MAGKSVAIIEDDASANRALGRFLGGRDLRRPASTPRRAFLADGRPAPFGCVLVDVQLKGMSGLELQRQLLAVGNRTP